MGRDSGRCSPKERRSCPIEDEPRPKRIRKQVERYGYEPKTLIMSNIKTVETRSSRKRMLDRKRRTSSRTRNSTSKKVTCEEKEELIEEKCLELCDLSEEVLLLILERIPAFGLINLSKTSTQFRRLCVMDTIWKQRCRVSCNVYNIYNCFPDVVRN